MLLAAALAFLANWWKISADRADTARKISAASDELGRKIAADLDASDRQLAASRVEAARNRRGEAYVEVLQTVGRIGHWAQLVRPMLDTNPPKPEPPLPDVEHQAASQAQLQVYGTVQVQQLWRAWDATIAEIQKADKRIGYRFEASHRMGPEAIVQANDAWGRLEEELRPAEREARRQLAEQMNRELAESPADVTEQPQPTG